MIEFENLHEVMNSFDDQPTRTEKFIASDDAPTARDVLAACLAEADKYENVIVMRFGVTKKPDGGCLSTADTRLSVRGAHAAMHGIQVMEEMLNALKERLAKQIIDDILGKGRNS